MRFTLAMSTFEQYNPAENESPIYLSTLSLNKLSSTDTLYTVFDKGVKLSGDKPFLGVRSGNKYEWETYNKVAEKRTLLGSAILKLIGPGKHNIGIYSINRPEWIISEQACNAYSFATVALCNIFLT